MPNVLLIGDTARSSELRHEIPLAIIDAFHYVEIDGRRVAVVWSIEGDRIAAIDSSIEIVPAETFPADDLIRDGVDLYEIAPVQSVRIARSLGLRDAVVPEFFPLLHADALRADGVELTVDQRFFDDRRRRKTPRQLDGIRRASRAAEAGTAAIAALLRRSEAGDAGRSLGGDPLTCELLRDAAMDAFAAHGCRAEEIIVARGPQSADGHDPGSGRLANDDVLVCDLFPIDLESACYSDMTRTFSVGEPDPELVAWHEHTREALELVRALVLPGADGAELYRTVCRFYEERGYRTRLSAEEGTVLREGFNHALGHGVGLEVHEAPALSRSGQVLVAGDVITLEPGLYRHGFGGVRLEDTVLVTDDGCETITDFPYDLDPARSVVETAR